MKRIVVFTFLILSFAGYSQRKPEITAKELKADVYFLASDSLKGRKPGTREADIAANYIRKQFIASGLKLICDNGFQYFDIVTNVTAGRS